MPQPPAAPPRTPLSRGQLPPTIEERLRQELHLIRQAGQAGFFLRNWELMRYAHEHDLPARGRGSSVGSLVTVRARSQ